MSSEQKIDKSIKKRLHYLLDSIPSASLTDLPQIFQELKKFVPDFTSEILAHSLDSLIAHLFDFHLSGPLHISILELLYKIVATSEDIQPFMIDRPSLLPSLFPYTRITESKATPILLNLFLHEPSSVIQFISKAPDTLLPLMETTASSQDEISGDLLLRIYCSTPSLMSILTPQLRPLLRDLPASCAIGIMIANSEMQNIIPENEFEAWLIARPKLTVFDAKSSILLYPNIWKTPSILRILIRTSMPQKMENVEWISDHKQCILNLTPEETSAVCSSYLDPTIPRLTNQEMESSTPLPTYSLDAYSYIRLYVLSHSNYTDVHEDVLNSFISCLNSKCERIAAATIQLLTIWAVRWGYQVHEYAILQIAAHAEDPRTSSQFSRLCSVAINAFARNQMSAAAIISTIPSLKILPEWKDLLVHAVWIFPHYADFFDQLVKDKLPTTEQVVGSLGEFVKLLGIDQKVP